jgi:Tol biopolymer transport system component
MKRARLPISLVVVVAMLPLAIWLLTGCSGNSSNISEEESTATQATTVESGESGNTPRDETTTSRRTSAEKSHLIRLTNMGGAVKPVFSPDGQKIAFINYPGGLKVQSGYMTKLGVPQLYVMNANGTNVTRIAKLGDVPETWVPYAFSPDGTQIAFTPMRGGSDPDIYVADADGTDVHNLTHNSLANDSGPTWSPDGTKIAFGRYDYEKGYLICTINSDGTNLTNLSDASAQTSDDTPVFSPTDEKLAFVRSPVSYDKFIPPTIYVVNADGTNLTRLFGQHAPSNLYFSADELRFSPKGDRIAFRSVSPSGEKVLPAIYVMNADGTNPAPITIPDLHSTWSLEFLPDGDRIAYGIRTKGNNEIYAVNTDGTDRTNLTNNPTANDDNPTFSPEGKMAFGSTSRDTTGKYVSDIYLMNLD